MGSSPTDPLLISSHPPRNEIFLPLSILLVLPMFMGYASLFSLQHKVKDIFGIPDDDSDRSKLFSYLVMALYLGNLFFRFGHNWVFRWWTSSQRVVISIISMMLSMLLIAFLFYLPSSPYGIGWVAVTYFIGGCGIGTFEANALDMLTPYGKKTQAWSSLGIPSGVTSITVGGFLLMGIGLPPVSLYFVVTGMLCLSLGIYFFGLPPRPTELLDGNDSPSFAKMDQLERGEAFGPALGQEEKKPLALGWYYGALAIDMLCVALFSPGVMLYLFHSKRVEVSNPFGIYAHLKNAFFFMAYNLGTFVGASLGRYLAYRVKKLYHPFLPLLSGCLGIFIDLLIGHFWNIFTPLGGFCVMFMNGFLYNQTWRMVDNRYRGKDKERLKVLSYWLLCGDLGSVTGSGLINLVRSKSS